jgi:hypothetical protein
MSFFDRQIQITITLGSGEFGDDLGQTVTLTGHRCQVNIQNYGGDTMGELHAQIFGLDLSLINKLTTIGIINTAVKSKNRIIIEAGNKGETLVKVYEGAIFDAWGDFNSAPDVSFNVLAYSAMDIAVTANQASTFKGDNSARSMLQAFANEAGLNFESSGNTDINLTDSVFTGSIKDKITACANAAKLNAVIENNTLRIWPKNESTEDDVIHVSPDNGIVGYPSYSSFAVSLTTEFLPRARLGGRINVSGSALSVVNGTWIIYQVTHSISSLMPNGDWFTVIEIANRDRS